MKCMVWMTAVLCSWSVFAAEELTLDGQFKEIKNDTPAQWLQNKGNWNKPWGEVTLRKEGEDSRIAIKSAAKSTQMFTQNRSYDAKPGELFEIKLSARGKGAVEFGIYLYDANNKSLGISGESEKLGADFAEYSAVIPVEAKPGTVPAKVRIYFGAAPDSEVEVGKISARKVDQGAVKLKFNRTFSAKPGAVEPDGWKMNNSKWTKP